MKKINTKKQPKKAKMFSNRKNIIISALALAVVTMAVGYAAFATTLNISGSATILGEWDVEITNIAFQGTGQAQDGSSTGYTSTSATFDCELYAPGDSCIYTITVSNTGSINAVLDSIVLSPSSTNSEYIDMTVDSKPNQNDVLAAHNGTHTIVITSSYKELGDNVSAPVNTSRTLSSGTLIYKQANS